MTFHDGRSYEPAGSYETGWSVVPWMIVVSLPPPPLLTPQPAAATTSSVAPSRSRTLRLRRTLASFSLPVQWLTSLDRRRFRGAARREWAGGGAAAPSRA